MAGRSRSRSPARNPDPSAERRSRSPIRKAAKPTKPNNPFAERREAAPRRNSADPEQPTSRSPSPDARPRKRPGAKARISTDHEAVRRRQQEREEASIAQARAEASARGNHEVVTQYYNAVPQRGKEWRRTDSKIKGLRSLNNWIKSAIIHKFAPSAAPRDGAEMTVLDIGCGKGGDLQKWHSGRQQIGLYVGLDPASVSIGQAQGRYREMVEKSRRGYMGRRPLFQAEFAVQDCFAEWIGEVPIVKTVGIDGTPKKDGGGFVVPKYAYGGFDLVSMMFCMHYAFEVDWKCTIMLSTVAATLKKGGRFIGTIPNSDVISAKVKESHAKRGIPVVMETESSDDEWDPEKPSAAPVTAPPAPGQDSTEALEFGNDIYRVRMPRAAKLPLDGVFRPPFGWKYNYFLEEAVEEVPEYVVPWEAFRAMAAEYNLELEYRAPFSQILAEERKDPVLGQLCERMGVIDRNTGKLNVTDSELEAANFYTAFSFYKV